MPRWLFIVRWLFTLVALIAFPSAAYFTFHSVAFVATAEETAARIVAMEYDERLANPTKYYRPTFEFVDDDQRYVVTPDFYTNECPGVVGGSLPILYDPRTPERALPNTFGYIWLRTSISLPFGLIFTYGCYILWAVDPKYLVDDERGE